MSEAPARKTRAPTYRLKLEAVARELGVKPMTAKKYLDRVRAKYVALGRDVHTKTELYKAAVADGRVRPSSNQ